MAKNVRKNSEKMAAVCPHCGFTQQESVAAKSTFCRKCQQHYNLERMLAGEKSIVKEPGIFSKLTRLVLGDRERDVTCFTCGHQQRLSKEAQSTMCPGCGAYMDLRDFKIAAPFGRSVQTAGDVHVTSKGDVTSTKIMCGVLHLEGNLRGHAICTGTATVQMKGRIIGVIEGPHILVDRKGEVEFARPIHTKLFEVSGKVKADVFADKVVINKGGTLEGSVHSKAITVEKGGIFSGNLTISQDALAAVKQPKAPDTRKVEPASAEAQGVKPVTPPESPSRQGSDIPPTPKPATVLKSEEAPRPTAMPKPTVVLKPVEPPPAPGQNKSASDDQSGAAESSGDSTGAKKSILTGKKVKLSQVRDAELPFSKEQ